MRPLIAADEHSARSCRDEEWPQYPVVHVGKPRQLVSAGSIGIAGVGIVKPHDEPALAPDCRKDVRGRAVMPNVSEHLLEGDHVAHDTVGCRSEMWLVA
jgi:hypothetical protein